MRVIINNGIVNKGLLNSNFAGGLYGNNQTKSSHKLVQSNKSPIASFDETTINQRNQYSTVQPKIKMVLKNKEEVVPGQRPTSPHVTIYKFPLPAVMSIFHRVTGIALGVGLTAVCGASLFGAHDSVYYLELLKNTYPLLVAPAKFCVAFPLVYHTLTGVRHLFWDETLKGLHIKEVDKSCLLILAVSIPISLILAWISI
ncbi:succinate dehydrogenase [Tieghemostelium lacteum]|uniref:Succinate dehydrogenase n=1 Tax=Tieghemostelium lacteum TaxID=361077 RepID=A0A152A2M0_TIELA|nr:succinate dehydrogenase [Tieghemostelium lacteum]|eukprot:KYR00502.1 succinate dehydrogenase [Tieghemostelium lacteum]